MTEPDCGGDGAMANRLPSKYLIAYDRLWSVVHASGSGQLGWLILAPRRRVMEVDELTDEEAAGLGVWQVRLARALAAEMGTPKTYIARFGEAPGHYLHFHVVARPVDLAPKLVGPGIFQRLGPGEHERVGAAEREDLVLRLRARLMR
jgi:diadenosine tetraphosphate (Ap4A) HIT family hydrolase